MPGNVKMIRHCGFRRAFCLFGLMYAFLCGFQAYWYSPTRNEPAHLAAGISHVTFQRFDLYRVNPPLVRSISALPVLLASPTTDWDAYSLDAIERREDRVGKRFAELNGRRLPVLLWIARCACIPFGLLGGWACGRWAVDLYGLPSGILAMLLWFFSPMITGYACLIAPDAHAAAMGVVAMYCAWRWLSRPSWKNAFLAGLVLGLTELTKFTLLVLYPVILCVWMIRVLRRSRQNRPEEVSGFFNRARGGQLLALIGLSILVINLGYGFEGTFKTLGSYRFQSQLFTELTAHRLLHHEVLAIPLPANYVQGMDTQRCDFEQGLSSYLGGKWSDHGWWYYYLYALAVKQPLGTWALVALAIVVTILARGYSASWWSEMTVLVPGLAILVFVSSQDGFSVHSRYVIPALPFLFVWTSKVARVFAERSHTQGQSAICVFVVVSVAWSIASSLWVYPHALSYFNELAGGPRRGSEHLLDSNIDWGQDLFYLKRWLYQHPGVSLSGLAYSGRYPTSVAGMERIPYPAVSTDRGAEPGWYAMSVNDLYGRDGHMSWFLRSPPVATVGYSFRVYHVRPHSSRVDNGDLASPASPSDLNGKYSQSLED